MGVLKVVPGGIYLESIKSKVGTGDTAKDASMENFYQATPLEDGRIKVQLLDIHDQPTTYCEEVDEKEFHRRFKLQENYQPRAQVMREAQAEKITARAERHLRQKEFLSAEFEFGNALKVDDKNVRANYGLGQTYMATGEVKKAKDIFKKLVNIDDVTSPRHKHIFNDFGIQLRKLGMYKEAVMHYRKALAITQNDENLWFNLGRALFEGGSKEQAAKALRKALDLNPDLEEAKAFLYSATKGG
ncbi:tetratricopeptide repeat protein [Dethiosulfatarculus sandiegensis]|uniref:Uncharacterized protein n=1 Tax=Dethiosulfatarculus sandiegensis TaxID=1429043 RepID=A0A0D2J1W9_9BACT|nr:tetratricopeptide repeat protein [Dethiosulfatarculus sandiegensis]KIX12219.1 hypothetical protein X474_20890 [Dethiosulfatarculus sandiegensis]